MRKYIKTNYVRSNRLTEVQPQCQEEAMPRNENKRGDAQKVLYPAC